MAGGELATLAEAAGQAVVTAAATDAWAKAKAGVARLLGRGDQGKTELAERRLEDTCGQLAATDEAELAATRQRLVAEWKLRLTDLLEEAPDAAAQLRDLVKQIRTDLPAGTVTAAGHALAVGRDYSITASGGGIAAGTIIQRDVSPPDPSGPDPTA